jgi:chromosome segregation ATPase
MEPTLSDVQSGLEDLRAYVDARLGALANQVDEVSLNLKSHRRAIEDLVTALDLAFRTILTALDDKVVEVRGAADVLGAQLESIAEKAESLDETTQALESRLTGAQAALTVIVDSQTSAASVLATIKALLEIN